MKKILLIVGVLLLVQSFGLSSVFADEIIDIKGNITTCKIVTVADGLIEFKKDGCLYSFQRVKKDPVYSDYVDVRKIVSKETTDKKQIISKEMSIERISGYIDCKNFAEVVIKTQSGIMNIPWYRVQNMGVYKPN